MFSTPPRTAFPPPPLLLEPVPFFELLPHAAAPSARTATTAVTPMILLEALRLIVDPPVGKYGCALSRRCNWRLCNYRGFCSRRRPRLAPSQGDYCQLSPEPTSPCSRQRAVHPVGMINTLR